MIPILTLPTIVIVLGGVAYLRRKPVQEMTPEQQKVYKAAINGALKDPVKLRRLSDAFAGEGFIPEARLLRQRALLRELPPHIKQARRQIWKRAMASKNKRGVLTLASAYEKEGCTTAAVRLREYASGLPDQLPVAS